MSRADIAKAVLRGAEELTEGGIAGAGKALSRMEEEVATLRGFGGLPKTGEAVQLNDYQSKAVRRELGEFGIKLNRGQPLLGRVMADGDVAVSPGNPAQRFLKFHWEDDVPANFSQTHEFRLKPDAKAGLETALDFRTVQHVTASLKDVGFELNTPVAAWHAVSPGEREAIQLRSISGSTIDLNIDGKPHVADGLSYEFHQGPAGDTLVKATGIKGPLATDADKGTLVRNLTNYRATEPQYYHPSLDEVPTARSIMT